MMMVLLHASTKQVLLLQDIEANETKIRVKIAVPLKYLSNFWGSLEIPLINCKVELSLRWIENLPLLPLVLMLMLLVQLLK